MNPAQNTEKEKIEYFYKLVDLANKIPHENYHIDLDKKMRIGISDAMALLAEYTERLFRPTSSQVKKDAPAGEGSGVKKVWKSLMGKIKGEPSSEKPPEPQDHSLDGAWKIMLDGLIEQVEKDLSNEDKAKALYNSTFHISQQVTILYQQVLTQRIAEETEKEKKDLIAVILKGYNQLHQGFLDETDADRIPIGLTMFVHHTDVLPKWYTDEFRHWGEIEENQRRVKEYAAENGLPFDPFFQVRE